MLKKEIISDKRINANLYLCSVVINIIIRDRAQLDIR